MAMMQWCSTLARRAVSIPAAEQRLSLSSLSEAISAVDLCGRGDKKTKKGKRFKGSFGKARPNKDKLRERFKDKIEVPRSTPWPIPFKLI